MVPFALCFSQSFEICFPPWFIFLTAIFMIINQQKRNKDFKVPWSQLHCSLTFELYFRMPFFFFFLFFLHWKKVWICNICFYLKDIAVLTTSSFDTHKFSPEAPQAEIQAVRQETERGTSEAHFGLAPGTGSCSMLMPKCVNEGWRLSRKGWAVNVHVLNNANTHKKQIMSTISKVIKVLGRCCFPYVGCTASWPQTEEAWVLPCWLNPVVLGCFE